MIYKEKWVRENYFDFGTTVEKSGLLSTPLEGPRPPIHLQEASKSKQKNLFKNQNFMKKRGENRLLSGCSLISARNPQIL